MEDLIQKINEALAINAMIQKTAEEKNNDELFSYANGYDGGFRDCLNLVVKDYENISAQLDKLISHQEALNAIALQQMENTGIPIPRKALN